MNKCKFCGNSSDNRTFIAQEMTLGGNEAFEYFECSVCKSIQIKEVPPDLRKYYNNSYFQVPQRKALRLRKWLKGKCISITLGNDNLIGRLLSKKITVSPLCSWIAAVSTPDSQILDIGCGIGNLLLDLHSIGYKNLLGIDPYIEKDINYYKNGPRIMKCLLEDILERFEGRFHLIILNHSLEHMHNPKEVAQSLHQLLQPKGYALIRTPLADSHAWKTYGIHWVQLDAPRHLCIPSEKSLRILLEGYFEVEKIIYDSTSFQYTGSEDYLHSISSHRDAGRKTFTKKELQDFKRQSEYLNAIGDGDQASVFLKKI